MIPTIHSRYDLPEPPGITFNEPTLAQQHFAADCDINNILKKYIQTGVLPQIAPGEYLDCADTFDYLDALTTIQEVETLFSSLPSHLRKHFNNSPAELLEFAANDANIEKGIEIGLYKKAENRHPLASPSEAQPQTDTTPKNDQAPA